MCRNEAAEMHLCFGRYYNIEFANYILSGGCITSYSVRLYFQNFVDIWHEYLVKSWIRKFLRAATYESAFMKALAAEIIANDGNYKIFNFFKF